MEFLRRLRLGVAIWLLPFLGSLQAAPPSPNEYSLKAVFLYNFCRFVDWPQLAFASPNDPLIIGIVGPDPFGPLLQEAIAGENYHGRPIRIDHYRSAREIRRCHLLFVSQAAAGQFDAVIRAVAGRNILTVGETEDFLDRGGMIALTAEENRVRLRINPAALRSTKLSISSKLLQVADIRS